MAITNETGWLGTSEPAGDEPDEIRRHELGEFLRSRRERILPAEVGLPAGGRRRTPGLRREEVAQLAGVGVTWYTWLEQGRDINVSEQVLDAVSRTLRFDPHERAHLMRLAGLTEFDTTRECEAVPEPIHKMLGRLDPFPAAVLNACQDILAFNNAYCHLMCDISSLPLEDRNCLWLACTHPVWRESMLDWEEAVARLVAQFRGAMAEHLAETRWRGLVRRLSEASPEFVAMWERHEVVGPENRKKQLLHAEVGLLRLDLTGLWLGPLVGTRLVSYVPSDDATLERLERLALLHPPAPRDESVLELALDGVSPS